MKKELKHWVFAVGDGEDCLRDGKEVTVPHTWNIEEGKEEYWGTGWYEHSLDVPEEWADKRVRLRFGAAYHSAVVYVNGREAGKHVRSGYTPFTVELTELLEFGEKNRITVRVSNEFSEEMLPYKRSFDWANDGGLIRGVSLLVTGRHFLDRMEITARPILLEGCRTDGMAECGRVEKGPAVWGVRVRLNCLAGMKNEENGLTLGWELIREGEKETILRGKAPCAELLEGRKEETAFLHLPERLLKEVDYWHFDHPALYRLRFVLKKNGVTEDEAEQVFGFRDFHVRGSALFLNGEQVRLCGTEWMPGSDPVYGAAEPKEQLEKMLQLLKESNCIFTRFHWQQDDLILDWCDRHGMLVQEEVPFWGPDPEIPGELHKEIALQQFEEMYAAHCNHPSVIAWGVGNELCAQEPGTIRYIREAVAFARSLDADRSVNYVSNTWFENSMTDGTVEGDILMINDYIGTWHGEKDEHAELSGLITNNPGRAVVSSEFGLCEPAFSGGDARREQIFLEKMEAYREHGEIAGTIYFCLNDYRTQMGEDGVGKYRCRIHGSATMDGHPKPSYYVVQRECAPFTLKWEPGQLIITCRDDLPCYELCGYLVELRDDGGQRMGQAVIERLRPGESIRIPAQDAASAAVYRPTGDCAGVYSCK